MSVSLSIFFSKRSFEKITFDKDGTGVIVMVRMDKKMIDYLNKDTKFWIVKPEVGFRGISGLDTLITGTYINIDAHKIKKSTNLVKVYQGLNYRNRNNENGNCGICLSFFG